jgi:nucleoside 2-deoxyribosyltransferase
LNKIKVYTTRLYLAGPISSCSTLDEANSFREKAKNLLALHDIGTINPLRGKIEDMKYSYRPAEIVQRDKMDIRRADGILVDMTEPDHPYIGTSMEIMYAHHLEKPVFVVTDWAKDHYWIQYHATQIFESLEDAVEYIATYFF